MAGVVEDDSSDPFMTAYVIYGFTLAKQAATRSTTDASHAVVKIARHSRRRFRQHRSRHRHAGICDLCVVGKWWRRSTARR